MMTLRSGLLALFGFLAAHSPLHSQSSPDRILVNVAVTLDSLILDEDTDRDSKITIDDPRIKGTTRGDKRFRIPTADHTELEVTGTYYLSNLLQELKLAEETGVDSVHFSAERIFENPADRISRSIRERFWDGLTRRIDEDGLAKVLSDEKTTTVDGLHYVYTPASDRLALDYYKKVAHRNPSWNMKVVRLPRTLSAQFVRGLDGRHGLLPLRLIGDEAGVYKGEPYVVPGGRFNEMYGWDSYFITLGLLSDGRVHLAQSMVNNLAYEITHYGAILNANRTYYLTRSQPPFLSSMIREVYEHLPRNASNKKWLETALRAAITEYYNVWMNRDHLTPTGLSRYYDSGFGPPPEVEPGHFDAVILEFARKAGMNPRDFEEAYRAGKLSVPGLDRYFIHDRAMRESGHDTSYRLINTCADLVTVDLNSLLYKIEKDIGELIAREFSGTFRNEKAETWVERAERRQGLIREYFWNEEKGMFFDYNFVTKSQTSYESATTFYPLWAGFSTQEQADMLVRTAIPLLEAPGGIVSSTEESRGPISPDRPLRQWDYPYGWAPHQMIVWQGLTNYGYERIARRLAYRWLYTITVNAVHYNGTVPEKFDVVQRTHQVFAEYGNVGTTFAYITREGFGWTNASYQLGLRLLTPRLRDQLNSLIPPEWVAELQ